MIMLNFSKNSWTKSYAVLHRRIDNALQYTKGKMDATSWKQFWYLCCLLFISDRLITSLDLLRDKQSVLERFFFILLLWLSPKKPPGMSPTKNSCSTFFNRRKVFKNSLFTASFSSFSSFQHSWTWIYE